MQIKSEKPIIPIFLCVDDDYAAFAAVTVKSLLDNAAEDKFYKIHFLVNELNIQNQENILTLKTDNSSIEFISVSELLKENEHLFHTRDYYSNATYYRFFIPALFECYDKGIYIDSDIVVLSDIAKLYETELGDSILGAVTDEVVTDIPVFSDYSEKFLGIQKHKYFNAGILVMNFKIMREINFQNKLFSLMQKYKFTVAQDQDYLNVLCYNRVKYLDALWNKTPFKNCDTSILPHIVHFKINLKPWHYEDIPFQNYFWKYAEKTPYYKTLLLMRKNYSSHNKLNDLKQYKSLEDLALSEIRKSDNTSYKKPILSRG